MDTKYLDLYYKKMSTMKIFKMKYVWLKCLIVPLVVLTLSSLKKKRAGICYWCRSVIS